MSELGYIIAWEGAGPKEQGSLHEFSLRLTAVIGKGTGLGARVPALFTISVFSSTRGSLPAVSYPSMTPQRMIVCSFSTVTIGEGIEGRGGRREGAGRIGAVLTNKNANNALP